MKLYMEDGQIEYSKILLEDDEKSLQWRLTVSNFRGKSYLNIRKYFLSFEEDYIPTKEGATIPLSITATYNLFMGLYDILSNAERAEIKDILLGIDKSNEEAF